MLTNVKEICAVTDYKEVNSLLRSGWRILEILKSPTPPHLTYNLGRVDSLPDE